MSKHLVLTAACLLAVGFAGTVWGPDYVKKRSYEDKAAKIMRTQTCTPAQAERARVAAMALGLTDTFCSRDSNGVIWAVSPDNIRVAAQ